MIVEEEKIYHISNEDRHYYGEDLFLRRMTRENARTEVGLLQQNMEDKSYNIVSKQIEFLTNNYTCVKKKIQELMKWSDMTNNKNTHAYMKAAANVMFT